MNRTDVFPNFEAIQIAQIQPGDLILCQDDGNFLPHLAAVPLTDGRGAVLAKLYDGYESYLLSDAYGVILRVKSDWRFALQLDKATPTWRANDVPRGKIGITEGAQFFSSCSGMGVRLQNAPISLNDYSLVRGNGACAYFDWSIEIRASITDAWVRFYAPTNAPSDTK